VELLRQRLIKCSNYGKGESYVKSTVKGGLTFYIQVNHSGGCENLFKQSNDWFAGYNNTKVLSDPVLERAVLKTNVSRRSALPEDEARHVPSIGHEQTWMPADEAAWRRRRGDKVDDDEYSIAYCSEKTREHAASRVRNISGSNMDPGPKHLQQPSYNNTYGFKFYVNMAKVLSAAGRPTGSLNKRKEPEGGGDGQGGGKQKQQVKSSICFTPS
jgi:hypothetical protein